MTVLRGYLPRARTGSVIAPDSAGSIWIKFKTRDCFGLFCATVPPNRQGLVVLALNKVCNPVCLIFTTLRTRFSDLAMRNITPN